jgi:hypothetical protein
MLSSLIKKHVLNVEPVSKIVSKIRLSSQNAGYQCQKHEIERYEDDGERDEWDRRGEISDVIQQFASGDLERLEESIARGPFASDPSKVLRLFVLTKALIVSSVEFEIFQPSQGLEVS